MGNSKQVGFWFSSFLLLMAALVESGASDGGCEVMRCGKNQVSFPFRLSSQHPHCGYPGVYVSCSENEILLHLPKSNISVKNINYRKQLIQVSDPDNCFPKKLTSDLLSSPYFHFAEDFISNFTLFSCPREENRDLDGEIPCLSDTSSKVYAQSADSYVNYFPLLHCTKMNDVLEVPYALMTLKSDVLQLSWNEPPNCRDCAILDGTCLGNGSGTEFTTFCKGGQPNGKDKGIAPLCCSAPYISGFPAPNLVEFMASFVTFALKWE
ncbi:hypothetical protein SLA2020_340740 [Shorea laevis]